MSEANSFRAWNISDSAFASLIGTNYIPTTSELGILKTLLTDPELDLSQLEAEISRLQNALDRLFLRKQKIKDYIMAHKALASPVRQLPAEILAEIFVQCLPDFGVRDLSEAPLVLTRICRDWRRIAFDTPRLWQSLHIYLPPNLSGAACSRRTEGVTAWLERSGSLPLSISFDASTEVTRALANVLAPSRPQLYASAQNNMESMICTLMCFSRKIGRLFLSLEFGNLSTFANLAPSTFPSLTSFRLSVKAQNAGSFRSITLPPLPAWLNERAVFASVLKGMPLLTMLHIDHFFGGGYYPSSLSCNWKDLVTLNIGDFSTPEQLVAILTETPRLQHLTLAVVFGDSGPFPQKVVCLRHLSELRLNVGAGTPSRAGGLVLSGRPAFPLVEYGVKSVLGWFRFSDDLRLLSFSNSYMTLHGMVYSEWPFATLPLHNVETLELEMALAPQALQGLAQCLSQSYKLVTFRYNAFNLAGQLQDSHLINLTPSYDNPDPWCPEMQTFQIFNSHFQAGLSFVRDETEIEPFNSCTSGAVTAFLQRRFATSLKFCTILFPQKQDFTEAELETLRSLQEQGLKLRLYRPKSSPLEGLDLPDAGLGSGRRSESERPRGIVHGRMLWDHPLEGTKGPFDSVVIV